MVEQGSLLDLIGISVESDADLDKLYKMLSVGMLFGLAVGQALAGSLIRGPKVVQEDVEKHIMSKVGKNLPGFPNGLTLEQCRAILDFGSSTQVQFLNVI